jgi:hypothetical protein
MISAWSPFNREGHPKKPNCADNSDICMILHPHSLSEQIVHGLELLASFDFILSYHSGHHLILFRVM